MSSLSSCDLAKKVDFATGKRLKMFKPPSKGALEK